MFDAISHMVEEHDLLATLRTARAHLRAGGLGVFCPDFTAECFVPGTTVGGTDGADRGMRYLEWVRPGIIGTAYRADLVYVLRYPDGEVRIEHDGMTLGAFSRTAWVRALAQAGFGEAAVERQSGRDVFLAEAV